MDTSRRTLLAATLVCGALAAIGGCARERPDDRIVLGFSQLGETNSWRRANSESIRSAAATSNIDLRFENAGQQQEEQIRALRSFIAQKVDVIAFAPLVGTGWDEVLREAKAANIPVILTDRADDIDPSLYARFLGSDFVEQGRKAARWIATTFAGSDGTVNVVELRGTEGAGPAIDRHRGFAEVLAAHPELVIIRSENGDFTREAGHTAMGAILAAEKRRIDVVFAHNDDMALGAIQAIEEAGMRPGKDIRLVSVDAVRAAFDAMIAGKLNATIECNPLLGPQLMTSVTEVVSGRPIPRRALVDEQVFTMETAKQHVQSRKY